jgi:hypothetical protein
MVALTHDEARYLMEAYDAAPHQWFRPTEMARQRFSEPQIDRIVESLVAVRLIDCQPDCHARLTELGRRRAVQLGKPRSGWRQPRGRRTILIAVASASGLFALALILFR